MGHTERQFNFATKAISVRRELDHETVWADKNRLLKYKLNDPDNDMEGRFQFGLGGDEYDEQFRKLYEPVTLIIDSDMELSFDERDEVRHVPEHGSFYVKTQWGILQIPQSAQGPSYWSESCEVDWFRIEPEGAEEIHKYTGWSEDSPETYE